MILHSAHTWATCDSRQNITTLCKFKFVDILLLNVDHFDVILRLIHILQLQIQPLRRIATWTQISLIELKIDLSNLQRGAFTRNHGSPRLHLFTVCLCAGKLDHLDILSISQCDNPGTSLAAFWPLKMLTEVCDLEHRSALWFQNSRNFKEIISEQRYRTLNHLSDNF